MELPTPGWYLVCRQAYRISHAGRRDAAAYTPFLTQEDSGHHYRIPIVRVAIRELGLHAASAISTSRKVSSHVEFGSLSNFFEVEAHGASRYLCSDCKTALSDCEATSHQNSFHVFRVRFVEALSLKPITAKKPANH